MEEVCDYQKENEMLRRMIEEYDRSIEEYSIQILKLRKDVQELKMTKERGIRKQANDIRMQYLTEDRVKSTDVYKKFDEECQRKLKLLQTKCDNIKNAMIAEIRKQAKT